MIIMITESKKGSFDIREWNTDVSLTVFHVTDMINMGLAIIFA